MGASEHELCCFQADLLGNTSKATNDHAKAYDQFAVSGEIDGGSFSILRDDQSAVHKFHDNVLVLINLVFRESQL